MRRALSILTTSALLLLPAGGEARLTSGEPAPPFELKTLSGDRVSPAVFDDNGLTILAFFSVESKPSRELALALAGLRRKHADSGLGIVGIAPDDAKMLEDFSAKHSLGYAICADPSGQTMKRYGAADVLPVTYIVGPGGTIARKIAGGGIGAQHVLLAVAEKEFAAGNAGMAEDIYASVAEESPGEPMARAGRGYALIRDGKLERAEEEFRALGAAGTDGSSMAAEGLADLRLRQGDLEGAEKALAEASAESGYAAVIRSEIATRRGDPDQARKQLAAAEGKKFAFSWQEGMRFNNLARIEREAGNTDQALTHYDKAISAEPMLVEARSNKAVALEKSGRISEARKEMAHARKMAPDDQLVTALLRRLERREEERNDLERQKMTNQLVGELAAAYRSGELPAPPKDEWSPRARVVSFIDVDDELGASARDGMTEAFQLALADGLQSRGVRVVEREILDKLVAELKLGASELADKSTRRRLGRVLSAAVIGTGGWYPTKKGSELQLRLIDTETTEIRETLQEPLSSPAKVGDFADSIAERLAGTLRKEYPLRGKIASVDGGEILVGIGAKHGLAEGLRLRVVEDGEPVKVDGEVIGHKKRTVGELEIEKVEDGFAYAKAVSGSGFSEGQHLVEVLP